MTPEELVAEMPQILIHKGQVFFNTRVVEIALAWVDRGARAFPWYTSVELQVYAARGWQATQGYEVHPLAMLERVVDVDPDGEEIDITADLLLEAARAKVTA